MKSFKIWLETSRLLMKRELGKQFLSNLGYNKDALENQDIDFDSIPRSRVKAAINQLNVDDEYKQKLIRSLKINKQGNYTGSVRTFINQIDPLYIKEKQDKAFTYPAFIPQSQSPTPRPLNQKQQATKIQ